MSGIVIAFLISFSIVFEPRQISQQARAAAVLDDLRRRAAAVDIENIRADLLRHLRAHRHSLGLPAEDLHRERPLFLVKTHLPLRFRIMRASSPSTEINSETTRPTPPRRLISRRKV